MNNIEKAVSPLKEDAQERAEQEAVKLIEKVKVSLSDAGNDLKKAAPYPDSFRMGRNEYITAIGKRTLYSSLVDHRQCTGMVNEPDFVDISNEKIERFIKESRDNAAFQYDKFVAKLVGKIGDTKSAILSGNHVWGYSILTIELPNGESQNWKTQQIVNVSKLGKLFNQWPTRKLKK